jgi:putative ABC transport system ATP-binding protein
MIELERIEKTYRRGRATVAALRGVDLAVREGEWVAIRGTSGSGKSSLLHIIGCLDRPTAGCYRLQGHDLSGLTDRQLSRLRARRFGFVFQAFHLLPRTTALENVETPLLYAGARSQRDGRRRARAALERVGLGERLRHYASELSGGEQQRVALARALVNDPGLILADEPTGNLDAAAGAVVLDLLAQLHQEGRTLLMVTHDDGVAGRAQRQVWLRDGRTQEAICAN